MTELGTEVHVSGHETRRLGTPPHGCARLMGTTAVAAAMMGATSPPETPAPGAAPACALTSAPAAW